MLQSLLEDRFKLVVRREQREMPIYSLVVERSDARLGPGLQRVDDCKEARSRQPVSGVPVGPNNTAGCGPIAIIAAMAARQLSAPVVNKAGVTGTFAYSLSYSADLLAANQDAPSFPTALRQQLGLKLEPTRGPVDVLVIDSVQPPTEN